MFHVKHLPFYRYLPGNDLDVSRETKLKKKAGNGFPGIYKKFLPGNGFIIPGYVL